MSKQDYKWLTLDDFSGGVNLSPEEARPNQLLDARNVWAPQGRLEQRPGYELVSPMHGTDFGLATYINSAATIALPYDFGIVLKESGGVFTEEYAGFVDALGILDTKLDALANPIYLALDSVAVGDTLYFSTKQGLLFNYFGWGFNVGTFVVNTAVTGYIAEIYIGDEWIPLTVHNGNIDTNSQSRYVFPAAGQVFTWDKSKNLSKLEIEYTDADGVAQTLDDYWIRITLTEANPSLGALIDGINFGSSIPWYSVLGIDAPDLNKVIGFYVVEEPTFKSYIRSINLEDPTIGIGPYATFDLVPSPAYFVNNGAWVTTGKQLKTNLVYVPALNLRYIILDNVWYEIFRYEDPTITTEIGRVAAATVETDSVLVGILSNGDKAVFHPDYIPQFNTWPLAEYGEVYQGQIFAAKLQDNNVGVRWSAPFPAAKVWPNDSFVNLVEVDKSSITGIKAFGEHLAIFKRDSIWRVIYTGPGALSGLNTYNFIKIPGEIGTVSNKSIVDINATLFFLAEDGVYIYDGVSLPQKISGPVQSFIDELPKGQLYKAAAVHWRAKHCYLLSVTKDGSENDHVLVYDYEKKAWWIWDNIKAIGWFKEEGIYDEEIIGFYSNCNAYYLNTGNLDGLDTISSYIQTHRLNSGEMDMVSLRELRLNMTGQDIASLGITIQKDDEALGNAVSANLDLTVESEYSVSDGKLVSDAIAVAPAFRRCLKKLSLRQTGRTFSIKIINNARNKVWELYKILLGFIPWSKR